MENEGTRRGEDGSASREGDLDCLARFLSIANGDGEDGIGSGSWNSDENSFTKVARIPQSDTWDCGVACLLMVAHWLGDGTTCEGSSGGDSRCHCDKSDCENENENAMEAKRSRLLTSIGTQSIWTSDLVWQLHLWKEAVREESCHRKSQKFCGDRFGRTATGSSVAGDEFDRNVAGTDAIREDESPPDPTGQQNQARSKPRSPTVDRGQRLAGSEGGGCSLGAKFRFDFDFVLASRQLMDADEAYRDFGYYRGAFDEDQARVARTFRDLHRGGVPMVQTAKNSRAGGGGLSMDTVTELVRREDCIAILLLDNRYLLGAAKREGTAARSGEDAGGSDRDERRGYSGHYVVLCGISHDPRHVGMANRRGNSWDRDCDGNGNGDLSHDFCYVLCNPDPSSQTSTASGSSAGQDTEDGGFVFVTPLRLEAAWRSKGTDEDVVFLRRRPRKGATGGAMAGGPRSCSRSFLPHCGDGLAVLTARWAMAVLRAVASRTRSALEGLLRAAQIRRAPPVCCGCDGDGPHAQARAKPHGHTAAGRGGGGNGGRGTEAFGNEGQPREEEIATTPPSTNDY